MKIHYSDKLKQPARELRKELTDAEKMLWSKIKTKQIKGIAFSRQRPIGIYIADFYCPKAKMVVEVDGGQHFKNEAIEYDKARDEYMESIGLKVLRFTNTEVLGNIDGVVEVIEQNL